MNQGKILAIDDEQNIRHLIKNELSLEEFDVTTASSGEEGLRLVNRQDFDVVLLDIKLPKMSGIETLRCLKEKSYATEVIMITGYGDVQSAVESLKLGARDYVTKPFKLDDLLALVRQAVRAKRDQTIPGQKPLARQPKAASIAIWCPSLPMQQIYGLVKKVAPTDRTVLIQGETGSGKDVLAHQIHCESNRKNGPYVTLDCGLVSNHLAESELYGHKKGAFSGASESKMGLVERSHQGTLFLDEIGNIDLDLQKKFLRFIETKRFRRVGETKESEVDTRLILATNLDLQEAMRTGRLREDLFYRMDVIQIRLPALRERPEDIACLAKHFLAESTNENSSKELSDEAKDLLLAYPWPGNLRELRSVLQKALIFTDSDIIRPDDLPNYLAFNRQKLPARLRKLEDMEKDHIIRVLHETGGNQSKASEILGINRKTLYKKIRKYKIFS